MMQFDITAARKMRDAGSTWAKISKELGVSDYVLRHRLDSAWAERRRQQVNRNRKGGRYVKARPVGQPEQVAGDFYTVHREGIAVRLPLLSIQRAA